MKLLKKFFLMPFRRKIAFANYDRKKNLMIVVFNDGIEEKYFGGSTVWRKYPMMERCNTLTESKLSEIYAYIERFGNSYPDAHLRIPD